MWCHRVWVEDSEQGRFAQWVITLFHGDPSHGRIPRKGVNHPEDIMRHGPLVSFLVFPVVEPREDFSQGDNRSGIVPELRMARIPDV